MGKLNLLWKNSSRVKPQQYVQVLTYQPHVFGNYGFHQWDGVDQCWRCLPRGEKQVLPDQYPITYWSYMNKPLQYGGD